MFEIFHTQDASAASYTINLEGMGRQVLRNLREEMAEWNHGLAQLRPWVSKLHGQALRLALAIHLWLNVDDPYGSPITDAEMLWGVEIAKNTVNSAFLLHSPYGLKAVFDAKKIIESYQRITGICEQDNFLQNGTDSRRVQQRIGGNRIEINNALQLLSWKGWVALYDDGSGNFRVLPRLDFFCINITEL